MKNSICRLYQDGEKTKIVFFINDTDAMVLIGGSAGEVIKYIDIENEIEITVQDVTDL